MAAYRRRRRFGSTARAAVTSSSLTMPTRTDKRTKKAKYSKCSACNVKIMPGEPVVRVRLKKIYQVPCAICSHKPTKLRWFHASCVPADLNKAMGFDPNAHAQHAQQTNVPPSAGQHQVAPPTKPQSAMDAALSMLLAAENALQRRLAEDPRLRKDAELAKTLTTYNACKVHFLRNKNDNEALAGLKQALKRCIELAF